MKKNIILLVISFSILISIITRFYKLGEAPNGLYLDEAAQGYNAYSILKTGKDEFGKSFPIVFRSFTDFKTPVYIYLIVPLIPVFDLTKFTVRFPSFIFSILTIPVLYLLIQEIAPRKYKLSLGLISTILLSISPWHILFGRTNFECNVALFFLLTGILFFYRGLKQPKELLLAAIFLAIAIPSYHAQRIVTPLIVITLFLKYRKKLLSKTHKNFLFAGAVIGFLLLIPTLSVAFTPGFLARANGLNIFTHARQTPAGYLENYQGIFRGIVNSPLFLSSREFVALYLSYFSPREMFVLGDYGPRSSFPDLSTFFLWQFPFYLIGLFLFLKRKDLGELKYLTLSLLFISPIPAAVTRDPYSTIRSLQMVIPLLIIIGFGLIETFEYFRNTSVPHILGKASFNLIIYALSLFIFIYSLSRLYSSVIILNEYYRASEWNYGFEQVAGEIKTFDSSIPIVIDNSRTEPYSQVLFFLKFDPSTYQKENFEVPLNEYYTNMNRKKTKIIGNITTRGINWKEDLAREKYLIGDSLAISYEQIKEHNLSLISEIKYPDQSVAFRIVKTNP